ncbi:hypothetical protein N9W26_01875, partial [Flavobacteriaceae bacterium]|nr:hypothetical protein [Flavobacteriaceae bacterium]
MKLIRLFFLCLIIVSCSNNYKVKGSTTTKEKLEILKNEGIDAYLIDVAENSISNSFESFLYELDILIV